MAVRSRGGWKTMLSLGILALALPGCGDGSKVYEADEEAAIAYSEPSSGGGFAGRADHVSLMAEGASPDAAPVPQAPATSRPRLLIRTGNASVEVAELDVAVEAVRALAERMGGFLTSVGVSGGNDQTRSGSLVLRIPADRFDETLAALDSLGDVESVHVSSEDVGETYADLEIRIANARRLEQRLLELLATRTGSLEDVLAVERELARVRVEIESMDAQLRSMRDRVDMSTISVHLHEPEPFFTNGGDGNVVARAFRQAGRNFVGFVAGFIASLGVILPALAMLGLAWWGWSARRRRRRQAAGY